MMTAASAKYCIFLDIDDVIKVYGVKDREASGVFTEPNWSHFMLVMDELQSVDVVILSSWKDHYTLGEIKSFFSKAGFDDNRIIGVTPSIFENKRIESRGEQVGMWLEVNQSYTRYIIIDDAPMDHFEELFDRSIIVQPDMNIGLTDEHAKYIIRYFAGV